MLLLRLQDLIIFLNLSWIGIFKCVFFPRDQDFIVLAVLRQKVSEYYFFKVSAFLLIFYGHQLG